MSVLDNHDCPICGQGRLKSNDVPYQLTGPSSATAQQAILKLQAFLCPNAECGFVALRHVE
ncbi:MAG: hypothetical protein JO347_10675 [Candidatus Eremiobacteraeota bacterium]|nr:hypothetical protein [Candidatus Eremiobacteraeota bacterium]MBV8282510.1 hypothetical protein [Candidatus Eremiobacteraeota bacterium]